MFELLLVAIALIGSFAAGIYDLKTSNVPDKVCLLMIISGLFIHIIYGFSTGDFSILINSLLFSGLLLAFGLLMYFTGQWGGGDGELLVAIGILLPNLSSVKTYFPFAISFFINSFFIGAAYSIIYSLILVYRNPKISKNFSASLMDRKIIVILFGFSFSIFFLFISQFILFAISILVSILFLFQKFSKVIEESFYYKISVRKLKVDDMLGEDILRLKLYKKYIKGLTKDQIRKIRKIRKYVIIREGIRYGIVFPLTLLFTLFFGDLFLFLL